MDNAALGINRLRSILAAALSSDDWEAASRRHSWFAYSVKEAHSHRKMYGKLNRDIPARVLADDLFVDGWVMLGAGHFGLVMKHKDYPGMAFKFSHKPSDAYMQYAMWARDNAGLSPHLPTIHGIYKCDDFVVFALDELRRVDQCEYEAQGLGMLEGAARSGAWPDRVTTEALEDLIVLCMRIGEFFRGVASIDLHSDNVMRCPKTGRIIITDPVSFTNQGGSQWAK